MPKPRHKQGPNQKRKPIVTKVPALPVKPAAPASKPVELRTAGLPGLLWVCEEAKGGCGAQGIIRGADAVKHWLSGGIGQITCKCGVRLLIGKPERPRIVTPAQHAAEVAAITRR